MIVASLLKTKVRGIIPFLKGPTVNLSQIRCTREISSLHKIITDIMDLQVDKEILIILELNQVKYTTRQSTKVSIQWEHHTKAIQAHHLSPPFPKMTRLGALRGLR